MVQLYQIKAVVEVFFEGRGGLLPLAVLWYGQTDGRNFRSRGLPSNPFQGLEGRGAGRGETLASGAPAANPFPGKPKEFSPGEGGCP